VPEELIAVVPRMMAKKPADRYQTPAEVADALAPWAAAARSSVGYRWGASPADSPSGVRPVAPETAATLSAAIPTPPPSFAAHRPESSPAASDTTARPASWSELRSDAGDGNGSSILVSQSLPRVAVSTILQKRPRGRRASIAGVALPWVVSLLVGLLLLAVVAVVWLLAWRPPADHEANTWLPGRGHGGAWISRREAIMPVPSRAG
jgi:hypothetical protein